MATQKATYNFDVNRSDLYQYKKPEFKKRTESRLIRMAELGMSETGIASFGITNIMSGLYIEIVWHYSEKEFDDYIKWVQDLINEKATE